MQESDLNKNWYTSKTIWAGVVTIAASALGFFGFQLDADSQAGVTEFILTIVTAISGLVAIYGRVTATKKVK